VHRLQGSHKQPVAINDHAAYSDAARDAGQQLAALLTAATVGGISAG